MSAIAPHHPQNPIAYSLKSNSDRLSSLTNPIAFSSKSNSVRTHKNQTLIVYLLKPTFRSYFPEKGIKIQNPYWEMILGSYHTRITIFLLSIRMHQ
ncbi:MAG: hypothetical protein IM539_16190 [Pseudanabaena sp. M046S1SP1A06QC]|nr:hypothetical protein [Pseudanabaena sp. M046S1SP1A06QC]